MKKEIFDGFYGRLKKLNEDDVRKMSDFEKQRVLDEIITEKRDCVPGIILALAFIAIEIAVICVSYPKTGFDWLALAVICLWLSDIVLDVIHLPLLDRSEVLIEKVIDEEMQKDSTQGRDIND